MRVMTRKQERLLNKLHELCGSTGLLHESFDRTPRINRGEIKLIDMVNLIISHRKAWFEKVETTKGRYNRREADKAFTAEGCEGEDCPLH